MSDSDISSFAKALTLAKSALDAITGVVGLIPDATQREMARVALEHSKKAFATAEIQAAEALGHALCHCDWPTSICIESPEGHWKCRRCGKTWPIDGIEPGFAGI